MMGMDNTIAPLLPRSNEAPKAGVKPKPETAVATKEPSAFKTALKDAHPVDKPPVDKPSADKPSAEKAAEAAAPDVEKTDEEEDDPLASAQSRKKLAVVKQAGVDAAVDPALVAPPLLTPLVPAAVASGAQDAPVLTQDALVEGAAVTTPAVAGNTPGLVAENRAAGVNLANLTSVFEQIQSRLASGAASPGEAGQPLAVDGEKPGLGLKSATWGTSAADARSDKAAGLTDIRLWTSTVGEPSATQALAEATEAFQLAMPEDSAKNKGGAEGSGESGAGLHAFTPTVQFDNGVTPADAGAVAPEAAIADQVNYWISQGIQNAELTFDGSGSQPVEVSISLSGNEAHVEFRSDQADTREFLTGAASHLKDLLQQEGMVLSGLSVGSSSVGGEAQRERRQASNPKTTTRNSATEDIAARPVAAARTSTRAVDLFV